MFGSQDPNGYLKPQIFVDLGATWTFRKSWLLAFRWASGLWLGLEGSRWHSLQVFKFVGTEPVYNESKPVNVSW